MKRKFGLTLALLLAVLNAAPAFADSGSDMMSMLESMKHQMADLQKTIEQQNVRIQQLESRKVVETPQPATPVQGPSTMSDADFQKGIKDNLGEAVPWLKGAKYGGDFRLRMENFSYSDRSGDNGSTTTGSDRDRNRFRFRLRWGMEKDFGDDWKVGFRLASGAATNNTSTNQTLGASGAGNNYFSFKTILIDRAYALYSPNGLKDYGPLKGVTIGAGKFDNPFLRYATAIVWDADVTPEGAYEKASFQLLGEEENHLILNATMAQMILNEATAENQDAEVYGWQGALTWSTYNLGTDTPVDFTIAASYYDYSNYANTIVASGYQRTNTLAITDPDILDIYPEVCFSLWGRPTTLWYNYVENIGAFNQALIDNNGIHDDDTAWGIGIKYGKAKKKGEWEAFYGYYEIGANATVAAFNDSDFGGTNDVGFTNRKGSKFGLAYMLTDNLAANWTAYIVEPLDPSTLTLSSTNSTTFRSQADLVYKF